MKLVYDINQRPKFGANLVFALQQLLAIIAATLLVPMIVSNDKFVMDPAAALFGAGIGTLVYIFFTKRRSPVFLGSSFAFLGAMAGAVAQGYGYFGLIIGALMAGLVYVVIALIVKMVGTGWINKLLPPVIIGPTVAIIGLGLSGTATGWMSTNGGADYNLISILCGIITFFTTVIVSVKGKKTAKMIPFIIGIGVGYVVALIFTLIGNATGNAYLQVLNYKPLVDLFAPFTLASVFRIPNFTFMQGAVPMNGAAIGNIAALYVPVAFVVLAEHIADHKNLSSVIDRDLLENPGLTRTLLGDGVGSIVGSIFGGCPNTTYGESVGCVAITGNASVYTIFTTAIVAMIVSFLSIFVGLVNTIPKCVMGGVCVALYGFIAVSGLNMLKDVDLTDNRNLFVVSSILVPGIGGLELYFGGTVESPLVTVTSIATALIIGIVTNYLLKERKANKVQ